MYAYYLCRQEEECTGLAVCTNISKILMLNKNNSANDIDQISRIEKCQKYFKCENDQTKYFINQNVEPRGLSVLSNLKHPIRKPKDSYKFAQCRKCERKRSKCTTVSVFLA